jgi:Cu+-exporting ATPase
MPTKIRKKVTRSAKDPVCGASVDPDTSLSEHEGEQDYYFCSDECRQRFKDSPSDFMPE